MGFPNPEWDFRWLIVIPIILASWYVLHMCLYLGPRIFNAGGIRDVTSIGVTVCSTVGVTRCLMHFSIWSQSSVHSPIPLRQNLIVVLVYTASFINEAMNRVPVAVSDVSVGSSVFRPKPSFWSSRFVVPRAYSGVQCSVMFFGVQTPTTFCKFSSKCSQTRPYIQNCSWLRCSKELRFPVRFPDLPFVEVGRRMYIEGTACRSGEGNNVSPLEQVSHPFEYMRCALNRPQPSSETKVPKGPVCEIGGAQLIKLWYQ